MKPETKTIKITMIRTTKTMAAFLTDSMTSKQQAMATDKTKIEVRTKNDSKIQIIGHDGVSGTKKTCFPSKLGQINLD